MATNRKAGRPKKPLTVTAQPLRGAGGRVAPPPLQDKQRHFVALYYAHTKVIKMTAKLGHRTLGANRAAIWLAMLDKSLYRDENGEIRMGLLKGAADEGGFVPVVPLRPGTAEPITAQAVGGLNSDAKCNTSAL
jgi:hypothetical protein